MSLFVYIFKLSYISLNMPKLSRKVEVRVTDRHYKLIRQLVSLGEYDSMSEVMREGIEKLIEHYSPRLKKYLK
jgi:Arc/MetJ-type ribon-helix-helix transcriptional regulator